MPTPILATLLAALMLIVPLAWATSSPGSRVEAQQLPTLTLVPLTLTPLPEVTLTVALPTATLALPTATLPGNTAVPTLTLVTPGPTATPGAPAPDLSISWIDAPDFAPVGEPIPYILTITNNGNAASLPSTVVNQLPSGTELEGVGPGCTPAGFAVTCALPPLPPGGTVSFHFAISAQAGPGTIVNTVTIDPGNAVVESNESNNTATVSTIVVPPPPGFQQPAFPPAAQPIQPAPAPPVAVVPPIDVAGVQVVPPQAAPGELWLQIMAPTQAFSVDMDPLWVATPGEWYIVTRTEGGWALAVWEGDTTGWSVWIPMDERVSAVTVDRADPRIATEVWLVITGATEAISASSMQLAWITSPGEWYRVLQHDGRWALTVYETDPPDRTVWIQIDGRVELSPGDAPHSPA